MKLSNASIKKLIKGACYHEERVDHCTFGLYINGVAHAVHYTQNVGGSVANFTLPDGEKHICIYFPSWGEVGIKALTINGKIQVSQEKANKAFGSWH